MHPEMKRKMRMILALAAIAVLATPVLIRHYRFDNLAIGPESYLNMRLSREISIDPGYQTDHSVLGGVTPELTPYHYLNAFMSYLMGDTGSSIILPFILGLTTVLLLHGLLRELEIGSESIFATCLIFILSPGFIWLFATSNSHGLYMALLLLTCLLFTKRKYLCLLPFVAIPFFGLIETALALLSLLLISRIKKTGGILLGAMFILSCGLAFVDFVRLPHVSDINFLATLISSLGARIGVSVFSLMLSFIGIFYLRKKRRMIWAYIPYIGLFFLLPLSPNLMIYAISISSAMLAGYAAVEMMHRRWEIGFLKVVSLMILICGITFSSLAYLNRMPFQEPDVEMKDALSDLKHSEQDTVIFAIPEYGTFVSYFSGRSVLLDSRYIANNAAERRQDIYEILYAETLNDARDLLEKYSVDYIYLNDRIREEYWDKEEGLIFLLRNNETFNKTAERNGHEIWRILDY